MNCIIQGGYNSLSWFLENRVNDEFLVISSKWNVFLANSQSGKEIGDPPFFHSKLMTAFLSSSPTEMKDKDRDQDYFFSIFRHEWRRDLLQVSNFIASTKKNPVVDFDLFLLLIFLNTICSFAIKYYTIILK